MLSLYTDGGCSIKNPSPHGIAWAFCVIEETKPCAEIIHKESGSITTARCGKFPATNNLAEMIAAVKGLEYCDRVFPAETVTLFCDSELTIKRLTAGYSMDKLPKNVRERAKKAVLAHGITLKTVLVAGHPTKKELKAGFSEKKQLPVSEFNVLVDKMCKEECKKLILNKGD